MSRKPVTKRSLLSFKTRWRKEQRLKSSLSKRRRRMSLRCCRVCSWLTRRRSRPTKTKAWTNLSWKNCGGVSTIRLLLPRRSRPKPFLALPYSRLLTCGIHALARSGLKVVICIELQYESTAKAKVWASRWSITYWWIIQIMHSLWMCVPTVKQ